MSTTKEAGLGEILSKLLTKLTTAKDPVSALRPAGLSKVKPNDVVKTIKESAFKQGFHDRCAEYGVDPAALKQASEGPFLSKKENEADKNRKKGKPAVTTKTKATEETPKALAKKIKDGYSVGTVNK